MSGKVLSGHSSELIKCGWRHVSALGAHHGRDALAGSPEEGRHLGIVWIGRSHLPNAPATLRASQIRAPSQPAQFRRSLVSFSVR